MVAFYLNYTQQVLLKFVIFRGSIAASTTERSTLPAAHTYSIWLSYVDDNYIVTLDLIRMRYDFNKYNTISLALYLSFIVCCYCAYVTSVEESAYMNFKMESHFPTILLPDIKV